MALQTLTAYCTIDDIRNRLSSAGVDLRTDDSPPDNYGDAIDQASAEIDEHCLLLYSADKLATSNMINRHAISIAVYALCERRGNDVPAVVLRRYDQALERLEMVRKGQLYLSDIGARKDAVPVMSNQRIILRPHPHSVTETRSSTGEVTDYAQRGDPFEHFVPDYVI